MEILKKLLYVILILFILRLILSKFNENFKDMSETDFESIKSKMINEFNEFIVPENALLNVYQNSQKKELPERLSFFKDNFKDINSTLIDDLYFDLRLYDSNQEKLDNLIKAYFYLHQLQSTKKIMEIEIKETDLSHIKNLLMDYVKHNEFTKKKDEY